MDDKERLDLILRLPTEEVLTKKDLVQKIETDVSLKHYIGLEISGRVHLGQGLACMAKVSDFNEAGVSCSVFLADWHAWINNKLGGKLENIQKAAIYFQKCLEGCLEVFGTNPEDIEFVLGSELYHHNDEYWKAFVDISKNITMGRIKRSVSIMGRDEVSNFATLLYPPMQVADIFMQGINLAHAGTDQRKAHVIAREVAGKLFVQTPLGNQKPVAIHHHLLQGLEKPEPWPIPPDANLQDIKASMKMSKSRPQTAIFVDDTPDEIRTKMNKAFCPAKVIEFNPLLDWTHHIIFREDGKDSLEITRPDKFGGDLVFHSQNELEEAFREGNLHPLDLKKGLAEKVIELLEPVRNRIVDDDSTKDWMMQITSR